MTRRALLVVAICAVLSTSATGQRPAASLSGIVIAGDSGAPARRATVSISSAEDAVRLSAITNDQGQFAFSNLPPARYAVTVSKPAYLTTTYGARRIGGPGTPVSLEAGQAVDDLRLTLVRGAVLAGVVLDQAGVPLPNVAMLVAPAAVTSDISTYVLPAGSVLTDDRGAFRIYGLAPGEYVLAAVPSIPPYIGRGATVERAPGELDAALRNLQQGRAGAAAAPARARAYAPIYYPGTAAAAEAERIRLNPGDRREGMSFSVTLQPTARLDVTVRRSRGQPAVSPSLSLRLLGPPLPIFSSLQFVAQERAAGTYVFPNLTPGRYVLLARAEDEWTQAELAVTGFDDAALALTLEPAMSLAGRVAFDGAATPPPADLTGLRIGLRRLTAAELAGLPGGRFGELPVPRPAEVGADGTFTITDIYPGRFEIFGEIPSAAGGSVWHLRSAVAGGRDLLDLPLEFGSTMRDVSGAVFTFSDRRAELTGRLQTEASQPASDYFVIIFSADRAHWYPGARRTRVVRPATDGEFRIGNLPAGAYRIAALTDVEPGEWQQASFLERVAPGSLPVTIGDGASVRQDLQLASTP